MIAEIIDVLERFMKEATMNSIPCDAGLECLNRKQLFEKRNAVLPLRGLNI